MPSRSLRKPPSQEAMTVDEFLEWNGEDGVRYELVDGEPVAMAPASGTHSAIQMAISRLVENHLIASNSPCRTLPEAGVIPMAGADFNFRIPDVLVTCSPDGRGMQAVTDPV